MIRSLHHDLPRSGIVGGKLRFQSAARVGCKRVGVVVDVPYRLFESKHDETKAELVRRYLAGLNRYLDEPIEDCLALDQNGKVCLEAKTPPELEHELALNRGNIFHGAPSWFFAEAGEGGRWGVETEYERIYRCGASAVRGGAVSGIPGHNAAKCIFEELGL